jgi:hypothetical protein
LVRDEHDTRHDHWIVFEGELRPEWSTTIAMLAGRDGIVVSGGERLRLKENQHLILESESFERAGPFLQANVRLVALSGSEFT